MPTGETHSPRALAASLTSEKLFIPMNETVLKRTFIIHLDPLGFETEQHYF